MKEACRRTCSLHEERNDVSNDKDLGQPLPSYGRMLLSARDEDDPADAHVDARREDGRGNEDEDGVDGVDGDTPVGALFCRDGSLSNKSVRPAVTRNGRADGTATKPKASRYPPTMKAV